MANKNYTDLATHLDNASASLTDITSWVTTVTQAGSQTNNSDAGLNTINDTKLPGLHTGTISLAGFINTTTSAIIRPLINSQTSITKTVAFYDGINFSKGEAFPTNAQITGGANTLQTWSLDLEVTGLFNATSVVGS